jgi:hypothetical protein
MLLMTAIAATVASAGPVALVGWVIRIFNAVSAAAMVAGAILVQVLVASASFVAQFATAPVHVFAAYDGLVVDLP